VALKKEERLVCRRDSLDVVAKCKIPAPPENLTRVVQLVPRHYIDRDVPSESEILSVIPSGPDSINGSNDAG
jgi:hypothetical protein